MNGDIDVQPNTEEGKLDWEIQVQAEDGNGPVLGLYEDKIEAIEWGIAHARDRRVELFIKRADGTIEDRRSYGNDPPPPESPDAGWEPDHVPDREPIVPPQDPETGAPLPDVGPDGDAPPPVEEEGPITEVPPPLPPDPDPSPATSPADDGPVADHESPLTEKPE